MSDTELMIRNADDTNVLMDNFLLRAKRQTNLLESKIEVLAIKKMQTDPITITEPDANGNEYELDGVVLNSAELKILTDRNTGSLFDQIHVAADRMMQRYIVIEEPKTRQFAYRHYYHEVKFSDGKLRITFETGMRPYLKNLSANYTKLSMPILWSFDTNGAFQLYVHLRSYVYKISEDPQKRVAQEKAETLVKEYNLAELRAELGYVDLDADSNEKIRREASKKHPDWDKIGHLEKTPKYKRWSDFSTRVLKPGIKEINEKSDIYISKMEAVRTGRGGKITSVKFYIQYNKNFFLKGASTDERRVIDEEGVVEERYETIPTDVMSEIMSIFPAEEKLVTPVDAEILYNDAKGDISRIRAAYEYARTADHITNFIGYMRKAIRDDYAGTQVEVMNGSRKAAEDYHNVMDEIDSDADEMLSNYWNKAKTKNTEIYQKFEGYMESQGVSVTMFEAVNTQAECGAKFMDWIKGKDIELI